MVNARSPFLPAFFPRIFAMLCVVVVIGVLALIGILSIALIGPAVSHGESTSHVAGTITQVGPGKDFVLQTETGQHLAFQCGEGCRASLAHLERHRSEHAHTDVYYIEGANHTMMALDVD